MPARRGPVFHHRRRIRVNRRLAGLVVTCTATLAALHVTGVGDEPEVRTTGAQLISDVSPVAGGAPTTEAAPAPLAAPVTTTPPTTCRNSVPVKASVPWPRPKPPTSTPSTRSSSSQ